MHSTVIIVNNTVLYTSKLLRDETLNVFTTKEVIIMWHDRGVS